MAGDDYYSRELHGPYQLFDIGDFELEDGGKDSRLQKPCWHCSHLLCVAENAHVLSGYVECVAGR